MYLDQIPDRAYPDRNQAGVASRAGAQNAASSVALGRNAALGVRNDILARLPPLAFQALMLLMERVTLSPRQVLDHWNMPRQHVYFIEHGLVVVLGKIDRDKAVGSWLIGSEGTTAVPLYLHLQNDRDCSYRRLVLIGGSALRMSVNDLAAAGRQFESLHEGLCDYAQFLTWELSRYGPCAAHHSLKQRVGRWLLTARDRLGSGTLPLTHQTLARMLGVRRAGVNECLASLQETGAIRNGRGLVEICDVAALETTTCDCYRNVRRFRP